MARPRTDRWHSRPTALLGGVAIYFGFFAGAVVSGRLAEDDAPLLLLCLSAVFLLGLLDDLFQLRPYAKLVGQILIATAWATWGPRLPWFLHPVLDQTVTIFWLVGITNALNLLDNMDGLAAGIAAITAAFLAYFLAVDEQWSALALAWPLLGAVLGFLVFNFHPASIFMGDAGSLFLGFSLGALALECQIGRSRNLLAILTVPVLLLLIPILDTTLVTLTRKLDGRPVAQGGRDHVSHRLVALGLSERNAVLVLYGLAFTGGAAALLLRSLSPWVGLALLAPATLAFLSIGLYLGGVRVHQRLDDPAEARGRALLPTLAGFAYNRRIFEVLHDALVIVTAYWAAFMLRFEGSLVEPFYARFLESLPLVLATQLGIFLAVGMYRGLWRYTSVGDLAMFVKAVAGAVAVSALAVVFALRFEGFSRAVFIIDGLLLLLLVSGSRLSFRLIRAWLLARARREGRRVLIYGAGDGGELALREMLNNDELGLVPVGFIDDDERKAGRVIHGVRVLGSCRDLPALLPAHQVAEILVTTDKIAGPHFEELKRLCREGDVAFRRMRIRFE